MLRKLKYAVYRGEVYKLAAKSQFTFHYLCDMKTFLHNLMGNEAFKDCLFHHIQRVLPIFREPESAVVPQLNIDKDLTGRSKRQMILELFLWFLCPRDYPRIAGEIKAHVGHTEKLRSLSTPFSFQILF